MAISESGNMDFTSLVKWSPEQKDIIIVLGNKLYKLSFGTEYLHFLFFFIPCCFCYSALTEPKSFQPCRLLGGFYCFVVPSTSEMPTHVVGSAVTLKDVLHCLQYAFSSLSFPQSTLPWYVLLSPLYSISNSSDCHEEENTFAWISSHKAVPMLKQNI